MMKINMILSCMLLWLVSACTSQEVVEITVSPEVTNAGYIGNGESGIPMMRLKFGVLLSLIKTGKHFANDSTL